MFSIRSSAQSRWRLALGFCLVLSTMVLRTEVDPSADFNLSLLSPASASSPSSMSQGDLTHLLGDRLDVFPRSKLPALSRHILQLCQRYRFDPALVLAVIQVESSFRIRAKSPVGALGLMQLMPATAAYVAKQYGVPYRGERSLLDPFTNLSLGVAYLSYLREKYRSQSPYFQFAAYNMGPGRLDYLRRTYGKSFRPTSTKDYYEKIRRNVPILRGYAGRSTRLSQASASPSLIRSKGI